MMKKAIPTNNVSLDYRAVLDRFVKLIRQKQKDNLRSVLLTGSYARGDATDASDLDVWCIFEHIDSNVLYDVGGSVRELPIKYTELEVNSQCLSTEEFKSEYFSNWAERSVKILDGVLLYGEDLLGDNVSISELKQIYKKYLTDILMSIRHYICVDEPAEKMTYRKIKTYILKPLMFSLRMERYCYSGNYPVSNYDLLKAYDNDMRILVEYFLNQEKFDNDIISNHREVLCKMHDLVSGLLK